MSGRLAAFLGLRSGIVGMLGAVILVGMGERLSERFLPIYLLALGGGALAVGLFNALQNLLNAIYAFPGGYLSDRFGAKRALLLFNIMAMIGFAIVLVVPRWEAVIAGGFLFLSYSSVSLPATMSLVNGLLPSGKRTMGVTMTSLVRRIPMSLGPLLGGLFIDTWGERDGVRLAFAVALGMALIACVLQQKLLTDMPAKREAERSPRRLWRRMSPTLRRLLVSDILIRFCEQIPYAFVVVWCMKEIAEPVTAFEFGLLTALEMATAVAVYIPVAAFADRGEKRPFVIATFVFFSLFPLTLFACRSFAWLTLAFVVRGLKEFGEPTRKALIMELAPDDAKAGMFGLYYLIRDSVVSLAAFLGAFLWVQDPAWNLFAAAGFGALGTLVYIVWGKATDLPTPGAA